VFCERAFRHGCVSQTGLLNFQPIKIWGCQL
jgi:hypothetical protein